MIQTEVYPSVGWNSGSTVKAQMLVPRSTHAPNVGLDEGSADGDIDGCVDGLEEGEIDGLAEGRVDG